MKVIFQLVHIQWNWYNTLCRQSYLLEIQIFLIGSGIPLFSKRRLCSRLCWLNRLWIYSMCWINVWKICIDSLYSIYISNHLVRIHRVYIHYLWQLQVWLNLLLYNHRYRYLLLIRSLSLYHTCL